MSLPSTIHGRRQIGITARRGRSQAGPSAHADSAASSQAGRGSRQATVIIRSSEVSASGSVLTLVTQTAMPAALSAARSACRFSSSLASTTSGAISMIRATSGFLVPPTRSTDSPGGCEQYFVAPATTSGAHDATASVRDGTSETMLATAAGMATTLPRSSRARTPAA